jgi:hypothetical protein
VARFARQPSLSHTSQLIRGVRRTTSRDLGEAIMASAASLPTTLILDAKGDLLFFRSAEHLEAYVEAIDVTNGEYGACWDAEGRLYELRVEANTRVAHGLIPLPMERVVVATADEQPRHRWDLHQALLLFVSDLGLQERTPLPNDTTELLHFVIERVGWS